jgi:hypothetical protein
VLETTFFPNGLNLLNMEGDDFVGVEIRVAEFASCFSLALFSASLCARLF